MNFYLKSTEGRALRAHTYNSREHKPSQVGKRSDKDVQNTGTLVSEPQPQIEPQPQPQTEPHQIELVAADRNDPDETQKYTSDASLDEFPSATGEVEPTTSFVCFNTSAEWRVGEENIAVLSIH